MACLWQAGTEMHFSGFKIKNKKSLNVDGQGKVGVLDGNFNVIGQKFPPKTAVLIPKKQQNAHAHFGAITNERE